MAQKARFFTSRYSSKLIDRFIPMRKRVSLVLSAFPVFVPSLSWQNGHFLL